MHAMTYAQTNYRTEAGRTIYTYRQRIPLFAPRVWLWCALGGLAIGVAGATANAVFEIAETAAFGAVLSAVALAAALVLIVLARLTVNSGDALRVTFDVLAGAVDVYRRGAHPDTVRYTLTEIAEFSACDYDTDWQHTCELVMHTTTQQAIRLLIVDRNCIPHTGLDEFAARLNMARDVALNDMRAVPPRPAQQPYIAPSVERPALPPDRRERDKRDDHSTRDDQHDDPPEHARFRQRADRPERRDRPSYRDHRHDDDTAGSEPHRALPNLPHIPPQMPDDESDGYHDRD